MSGDARRALDICRRAAEVAETRLHGSPQKTSRHIVGMTHVDQAIQEMFSSPKIVAMRYVVALVLLKSVAVTKWACIVA